VCISKVCRPLLDLYYIKIIGGFGCETNKTNNCKSRFIKDGIIAKIIFSIKD